MQCSSCNKGTLNPSLIDGLSKACTCTYYGGDWVLVEDYAVWRERHPDYEFAKDIHFEEINVADTKKAMLCPCTKTIMRKFKISATTQSRFTCIFDGRRSIFRQALSVTQSITLTWCFVPRAVFEPFKQARIAQSNL